MNHFELLALIQNSQTIYTFLVDCGLLVSRRECVCDAQMILKERQNTTDGYIWECPSSNCRKHRSVRVGSFFEDSNISLARWLYVIYLWSIGESNKRLSLLTGLSLRIRNICSMKILNGNFKLGGRGKTVEIDESMFGSKRKYNRGRVSEGQWVFGMVEQDTGRSLVFCVPDRQRETLVTRLVREFVEPGTVIISDKFSPYFNLNDVGYIHLMVNHSENFVDPYTRAHSNTIEGLWSQVKRKLKAMNGTTKAKLPGYIDEFNWSELHQEANLGDRFQYMLSHIAEIFPLN